MSHVVSILQFEQLLKTDCVPLEIAEPIVLPKVVTAALAGPPLELTVANTQSPPVVARGAFLKELIFPTFARIDAKPETQKIMWLRCCATTRG